MSLLITRDGKPSSVESQPNANDAIQPDSFSTPGSPDRGMRRHHREEVSATGQPILYVAALISVLAAYIHVLVVPGHFAEWWGYGVFFLVAAALQAAFALVLIGRASSAVLVAGIVGNLTIVAMWVISRTIGVPFFGPAASEIEEIGVHDIVATAAEIVLVVLLAYVIRSRNDSGAPKPAES